MENENTQFESYTIYGGLDVIIGYVNVAFLSPES
jgi:hypothetical protein